MLKNVAKISLKVCLVLSPLVLAACQGGIDGVFPKAEKPLPNKLVRKIKDKGMALTSPILIRIFKTENVLEIWKEKPNGQYAFLNNYEICKWSGKLGPKLKEGDKQAPEGFYQVAPAQMNPNSQYHLSFNMGFPNKYDRSHGRTGTHLMIHGACSSAGCYSMTDEYVEEIYGLAREAFRGGQKSFQIQAFPFRMTPQNLAKNVDNPNYEFWKLLKEGNDHFEVTKRPPKVDVCDRRYMFNKVARDNAKFDPSKACPAAETPTSLALAYTKKAYEDQDVFVKILSKQAKSPFAKDSLRSAAKKQTPLERARMAKLKQQQALLTQKQQAEVLEKQRALALAKEKARQEAEADTLATAAIEPAGAKPPETTSTDDATAPATASEVAGAGDNKPSQASSEASYKSDASKQRENASDANSRIAGAHSDPEVLVIEAPEIQVAKPKKKRP